MKAAGSWRLAVSHNDHRGNESTASARSVNRYSDIEMSWLSNLHLGIFHNFFSLRSLVYCLLCCSASAIGLSLSTAPVACSPLSRFVWSPIRVCLVTTRLLTTSSSAAAVTQHWRHQAWTGESMVTGARNVKMEEYVGSRPRLRSISMAWMTPASMMCASIAVASLRR